MNQDKQIIQPYTFTTARYDYSVYEKRIIYRILELMQVLIIGKDITNKTVKIDTNLFGGKIMKIPIKDCLKGDNDKNHLRVKDALRGLQKKVFDYEDEKIWKSISIIENPTIIKNSEIIEFTLNEKIVEAFGNFSKGYSKYILNIAFNLTNPYSMRFYELAYQNKNLTLSIEKLRHFLSLGKKYKLYGDLKRNILIPVQEDLYLNADFSFEFTEIKTGRKITHIDFTFKKTNNYLDKANKVRALTDDQEIKLNDIKSYLIINYKFSDKEISNNYTLLQDIIINIEDIEAKLLKISIKINDALEKKAYIIACLKNELLEYKERKLNS